MKHSIREKWERARKHGAQESVRCDCTGRDFLERIDEIVQRGLEDGEEAEAHHYGADDRSDPVDVLRACPAKDEHPACEKEGAEHHRWKSGLWDGAVIIRFEAFDVEALVGEVDYCSDEDAD